MKAATKLTIECVVFAALAFLQFLLFAFAIEPAFPMLFPISNLLFTFSLLWLLFSLSWVPFSSSSRPQLQTTTTTSHRAIMIRLAVYFWCASVPWSLWGVYRWFSLLLYIPFAGLPLALWRIALYA